MFTLIHFHLFPIDSRCTCCKYRIVTDSRHKLHQITEQRPVTMSLSLCTQTGLPNLTSQILNTRFWFLDLLYNSFTSVHYNLEYGLAIITNSFSLHNLNYITSLVKVQIRSDMTSHAIPDTVYLPCVLNCTKLVWTGHS